MTDERETLAAILDEADNKFQHGVGGGGYDPNGLPLWLADAVLAAGFTRQSPEPSEAEIDAAAAVVAWRNGKAWTIEAAARLANNTDRETARAALSAARKVGS